MNTAQSPAPTTVELDASQRAVVTASRQHSLAVLGAAGSGRTTTLVEVVADAVSRGTATERILAIGANRRSAADLRARLQERLHQAVRGATLGRTLPSVALEIVSAARLRAGQPAPRLLTGAQQDAILHDLLDGERRDAERLGVWRWGSDLDPETLSLRGFRDEVRDLLAAMVELGVTPSQLAHAGTSSRANDPEWVARNRFRKLWPGFAGFAERYFDVLDAGYTNMLDTPMAAREAARLLADGDTASSLAEVDLIVVDDAQELTPSARSLLLAFAKRGATVITFGDPDTATGAFHGGEAHFAAGWNDPRTNEPVPVATLSTVYRHGPAIRAVVQQLTGAIGASAGAIAQRNAVALRDRDGGAHVEIASSTAAAENDIVQFLRWQHLFHGVAWREMAVIVRSSRSLSTLAQRLERGGVPTVISGSVDFAEDATAQAILTMGAAVERGEITPNELERVLRSPLYGVDPLQLRVLRRQAYRSQLTDAIDVSEVRSGAAVIAAAVTSAMTCGESAVGEMITVLDAVASRLLWPATASALRDLTRALQRMYQQHDAGQPIDVVLYEAWHNPDRNDAWQRIALSDSPAAGEMNRRLDAVVALFERAKRLVEQEPGTPLSSFIAKWRSGSVREDSLITRADADAVTLTSPAGALGSQWRSVVVAEVNDGTWPNLRLRDSLLGAGRLREVRDNEESLPIIDRRKAVQFDEYRMLAAAISRARERVLISATSSEEIQPARILATLPLTPLPNGYREMTRFTAELQATSETSEVTAGERVHRDVLSAEGLAAMLRRQLLRERFPGTRLEEPRGTDDTPASMQTEALHALARLANGGVAAAQPANWYGIRGRSTDAPLLAVEGDHATVTISPSNIERLRECPVDAFLSSRVASPVSDPQWLGTLIHYLAEHESDFDSHEAMKLAALSAIADYPAESEWIRSVMRSQALDAVTGLWDYLKSAPEALGHETRFQSDQHLRGVRAGKSPVDIIVQLRGTIDRLELTEDGVRIVDFKTGRAGSVKATGNPQLLAYYLACVRGDIPIVPLGIDFNSAALVFPRQQSKRPPRTWTEKVLHRSDIDGTAAIESEFAELALASVGIAAPVTNAALNTGEVAIDTEPALRRDVERHCAATSFGAFAHQCSLHVTEEVCA